MAKSKLSVDVLTLFPEMFRALDSSIVGRAKTQGLVDVNVHPLRNWSDDPRHQKVDDRPFGGGAGMVIRPEPVYRALKDLGALRKRSKPFVVFLSPQGETFSQKMAESLVRRKKLLLLCGHYEGIDERLMEWVDQEISIGDYVLTGGEIPAMVLIDALARLVPGVVGDPASIINESFSSGMLDYPHYTRPSRWRGRDVPDVLLSGDHRRIEEWRRAQALERTKSRKPQLLSETKN